MHNNPNFVISNLNIHRLILAALVLAIKYLDDSYANNIVYAKIGGLSLLEFNKLEIDMLEMMNFNLYVDPEVYFEYHNELLLQSMIIEEERIQRQEEMKDCDDIELKPIRQIVSTESMETNAQCFDML